MDYFWIASALVLGLLVGSFLNVVIYRLPLMLNAGWKHECEEFLSRMAGESVASETPEPSPSTTFNIAFPNSHCPNCKKPIPAWCNIPIASFLILGGRCLHCKAKISWRYPLVELVSGIACAWLVAKFGVQYSTLFLMVFTWTLIVLSLIDIDHQLLPDILTLPLLWAGLLINSFSYFTTLHAAVFGAAFGYLSLWSVYWLFKILTKKEGMGFGDFKLLAALGAWMGWQSLPVIIILSSIVGAVVGSIMLLSSKSDRNSKIPFGPYLAMAGWISFFWGESIRQAYLHFVGIH